MKAETITGARVDLLDKYHGGHHWFIVFDAQEAANHVALFERTYFERDRTGYDVYMVPLTIDCVGNYILNISVVSRQRVPPQQMAEFMGKITGRNVQASDVVDLQVLAWASDEAGHLLLQLLDIFLTSGNTQVATRTM
jgi:hypothetical protein